jgi:hypothetical protein
VLADLFAQSRIDALPRPLPFPGVDVVAHGRPAWIVARQQAPLAAGAGQVEDGIDDAAQAVGLGMAWSARLAQQGLAQRPLLIGQISWRDLVRS